MANGTVKLHGPEAFEGMRAAGKLAAVADLGPSALAPGGLALALTLAHLVRARDHRDARRERREAGQRW